MTPRDQDARNTICFDLGTNLLVESAAGTGKTTALVTRMINLIREGACGPGTLVAVTFTRKAAAELRVRFQTELELECKNASGIEKERLGVALVNTDPGFIGTIHSFCAKILRERPIQAGVDIGFVEMDDEEDADVKNRAWENYVAELYVKNDPSLKIVEKLGVEIGRLRTAFFTISKYPDVHDWPAEKRPAPRLAEVIPHLEDYVEAITALMPQFPDKWGTDKLIPACKPIPGGFRQICWNRESDLIDLLKLFDRNVSAVKKYWPAGIDPDEHLEKWNEFRETQAAPVIKAWLEHTYSYLMDVVSGAIRRYEVIKRESGRLSYEDLLIKTAGLLKSNAGIRKYFRSRFSHLLVDEFQDTDPIQAEILMYLTAENPDEPDWRRCRPAAGSLFLVGDPKQSIYRFRRADIVTYNQVRGIIEEAGGKVVNLSTNFRTVKPLTDWVNTAFEAEFEAFEEQYSPRYVNLDAARLEVGAGFWPPVQKIEMPKAKRGSKTGADEAAQSPRSIEAELIARSIRDAVETKRPIARKEKENDAAGFGDFLIITPTKKNLGEYSAKLQHYGIPHEVSGGGALNQIPELRLLYALLRAVSDSYDQIALAAVLRSELFGISDQELYDFDRLGGKFNFREAVPEDLPESLSRLKECFAILQTYAFELATLPPVAAVERIAGHIGLFAHTGISPGWSMRAGSLSKAIELLRNSAREFWSIQEVIRFLEKLITAEEGPDTIPVRPYEGKAVRVMNLHKAKGLEAPVVFLADPTKENERKVESHIDRTTGASCGYLRILEKTRYSVNDLGAPVNWDNFAEIESRFLKAENLRLLYVAATRAGSNLIISSAETKNRWAFFNKQLNCPKLQDPGAQKIPYNELDLSQYDPAQTEAVIHRDWETLLKPTYIQTGAKKYALADHAVEAVTNRHAELRGTLIHRALESLMLDPACDVSGIITSIIAEDNDLDADTAAILSKDALETATRVLHSAVWRRFQASPRRFVEAPFVIPAENETGSIRGVIDLVFQEAEGWVIVDYKSTRAPKEALRDYAAFYKPQLDIYASAWEAATGEAVTEKGIFFTSLDVYLTGD
jgi:ATP-dependent helicase/nuclease subunit A